MRRLLRLLTQPVEQHGFHLHWSSCRRAQQAVARRCHSAARARAGPVLGRRAAPVALPIPAARPSWPDLTDAQWRRVQPLLPPHAPTGRPARDARTVVAGVLWVLRTGATWRDLPEAFGPWRTIYGHYRRWCLSGRWPQLHHALQAPET